MASQPSFVRVAWCVLALMALILRASALVSLIGLLDALPVCPMALLVFIDILSRRARRPLKARVWQIERTVKTVARALALAAAPRPTITEDLIRRGSCSGLAAGKYSQWMW